MQAWHDVTATEAPPPLPGWSVARVIGRGRGGDLLLVRGRQDPDRFALVRIVPPRLTDGLLLARRAVGAPRVAHLVRARTLMTIPGTTAVVVDLVEAGTLGILRESRGVLTAGELVTALAPVSDALRGLHASGLAHGCVDARHILLDPAGRPHLSDLAGAWARRLVPTPPDTVPATPADDVYGLGVCAWHCLAAHDPGPLERAWQRSRLRDLAPGLPPALVDAVEAAVEADPRHRPSAGDLAQELYASADPEALPLADGDGPGEQVTRRIPERFLGGAAPTHDSAPPHARRPDGDGALRTRRWLRPRRRHPRGGS